MKYKIVQETKTTLPTCGKFRAAARHNVEVDSKQIVKEVAQNGVYTEDIVEGVVTRLSEVIFRHLRNGDKVRLKDFGMMKLEIESEKVDSPEEFKPKKHIRGVRLHFIPESNKGKQELYEGIKFEKEKY